MSVIWVDLGGNQLFLSASGLIRVPPGAIFRSKGAFLAVKLLTKSKFGGVGLFLGKIRGSWVVGMVQEKVSGAL